MPNKKPEETEKDVKKLTTFRLSEEAKKKLEDLTEHFTKQTGFKITQADVLKRAVEELYFEMFPDKKPKK